MAYEAERRLIDNHQALLLRVRQAVTRYATETYKGLGSWRDADIERFVRAIVPVVERGQVQVSQLTSAYLDALARVSGIEASYVPPPDNPRGVPLAEVYTRPGVMTWTALSDGKPLDQAVAMGVMRLQDLILTDLQLAQTHTARNKANQGIVGWRRVLTGFENCALCVIASTQRYHVSGLMPIHPGCDCTVAPIYGTSDPGQVINADRLEDIYARLEQQGTTDTHIGTDGRVRDVTQIVVREHGEYGPTLSWRDHAFTGPRDI